MKITNKFGVPEPLVTLAAKEYYSKGKSSYSVTELLSPPKVRRLREQHNEQIESDVTDMLWQLLGSALHVVMERGQTEGHVTEERLFTSIDGLTISGQIDLQSEDSGRVAITDYKFCSAWAVMNEKPEWEQQLNVYKWLVETVKRRKVSALRICALIRDYSRHETRENYPAAPIQMVDIPMWDSVKAEIFIRERLDLHRNAKVAQDFGDDLPDCTPEERWQSDTTFAVKREGRKTAIRVFKSIEEAEELAIKEKGYVEVRNGEPKRCTGNYCGVAQWCDQYQRELGEQSAQA
jgi:PD-(D/E)XK nuclease superfamily